MGDDEDRARLAAMTMLEREQIIAEREERREAWRQRKELQRRLKAAEDAQRRADGEEEEAPRVRRRALSDREKKTSRLKELKAKRVAAGIDRRKSAGDDDSDGSRGASSASEASDSESDANDSDDWDDDADTRKRTGRARAFAQADQTEIERAGARHNYKREICC